jgi:protein tyrosine phosphatase (PTP) superfamily phosphohydrolase (DUF442 family)
MFRRQKPTPAPPGGTYEFLGRRKGLRGYVIAYDRSLYRGGAPTGPDGLSALEVLGVRSIVSICPGRALRRWSRANRLALAEIPFGAGGPSPGDCRRFLEAMRDFPKPVYLHCRTGERRAGALAILYRTEIGGWSWDSAVHEFVRSGGDRRRDAALISAVRGYRARR